jgi:hypothetical protein
MEIERHAFLSCDKLVMMEWKLVDKSVKIFFLDPLEFCKILAMQYIDVEWPIEQSLSSYRLLGN